MQNGETNVQRRISCFFAPSVLYLTQRKAGWILNVQSYGFDRFTKIQKRLFHRHRRQQHVLSGDDPQAARLRRPRL